MRSVLLAAAALVLLTSGATAAPMTTTVTIGETSATATACGGPGDPGSTAIQVAAPLSFEVPTGDWIMTSWSTFAGSHGGSMSVVVGRPVGPGDFAIVGASSAHKLTADELNTFRVHFRVQGGDRLGMWFGDGAACWVTTEDSADQVDVHVPFGSFRPYLRKGDLFNGGFHLDGRRLNISATLVPVSAGPATDDDCNDGGWQDYGTFKNQGDCESYFATGGGNPPAG